MAKNRINPDMERPTPLQPAAQPVDTYYRPMEPVVAPPPHPENGLTQIGKALSQFSNTVGYSLALSQNMNKQKDKADMEAGEALFNVYRTPLAEAMRKNPNAFNPLAQVGYEAAYSQNLTRVLGDEYALRIQQNPNQDPETLIQEFSQKAQASLGDKPHVYAINKQADAMKSQIERLRTIGFDFHKKNVLEAQQSSFGELITNRFRDNINLGISNQMTPEQIGENLNYTINEYGPKMGIPYDKTNALVTQSIENIVKEAAQKNKPLPFTAVQLGEMITTGTGKLGSIPEYREKLIAADQFVQNEKESNQRQAWALEDRIKKEASENIQSNAVGAVLKNPDSNISSYLSDLAKIDPEKAKSLAGFQHTMKQNSNDVVRDEAGYANAVQAVSSGTAKPTDFIGQVGKTMTADDYRALESTNAARNGFSNKQLYGQVSKDSWDVIEKAISPEPFMKKFTDMTYVSKAKLEFNRRLTSFIKTNPSEDQLYEYVDKLQENIIKKYSGSSTSTQSKPSSKPVSKSNSSQGTNTPKTQNKPATAQPSKPPAVFSKLKIDPKNREQRMQLINQINELIKNKSKK